MAIPRGGSFRSAMRNLVGGNKKNEKKNPFGGGGGGSFGSNNNMTFAPFTGSYGEAVKDTVGGKKPQPPETAGPKLSEVQEPTDAQRAASVKPPSDAQKGAMAQVAAPAQTAQASKSNEATLINPQTGERQKVVSGSDKASDLFGKGFVLEKEGTRQLVEEHLTRQKPAKQTEQPEPTQDTTTQTDTQPSDTQQTQDQATSEEMTEQSEQEPTEPSAMDKLIQAMQPTDKEQTLLDQLAQFRGDVQSNIAGMEGQGRGLTTRLVRGQQEKLAEQAGIKEQTLMDRLANLQAQRQAKINALQVQAQQEQQEAARQQQEDQAQINREMQMLSAGYEPVQAEQELPEGYETVQIGGQTFAKAPQEQGPITLKEGEAIIDPNTGEVIARLQEQQGPEKLSPGQTLVDPNTGQPVYTAPQERETITVGGSILERDPNTGAYNLVYQSPETGESGPPKITDIGGETYAWNSNTQSLQKIDVPDPEARDAVDYTRRLQNLAEDLLADPALEAATGPLGQYVGSLRDIIDPAAVPEFKRKFDQLVSNLTLENTSQIAGAISEPELEILRSAGTSLDLGQTTGQFVDELNRIIDSSLKSQYNAADITDMTYEDAKSKYGLDGVQSMIDEAITEGPPQEISFNQVGGDTQQAVSANPLDLGPITSYGSPYWEHGLDIDLQKGQPVGSPVSGKVTFVGNRGGFGKQIRIKDTQGREYWLSHLDDFDVELGQDVQAGQAIGLGGNSGKVIPGPQGDGSHLDLTVVDEQGNFIPPDRIASAFNKLKSRV